MKIAWIRFPLVVYFVWYLLILLFQIFVQPLYKINTESITLYQRLFWSWVTYWDSGHYVTVAEQGYNFPQQAFFPLWPLLIKIFSFFTGFYIASYFLSFLFGLTSFVLFYILAERLVGKKQAKYSLILFASFPSAFFLRAGYTEGLFLTLVLLSFLFLEQKKYFLSAVLGGFSTMTRLTGVALTLVYLFIKRPIKKRILLILLSLMGLVLYIVYLQVVFKNGFLFLDAQKAWCGQGKCQLVFPLVPILEYGRLLTIGWVKPTLSSFFLDWLFSILFLIMLIPVYKKLKLNYFLYSLVTILLPLSASSTPGMVRVGMLRYVLIAFPVFFVMPFIIRSKVLYFLICLFLFLLELRFIALFTSRIWVA